MIIMALCSVCFFFFFSSRRRHTRFDCDWSSDVCSSDLANTLTPAIAPLAIRRLAGGCRPRKGSHVKIAPALLTMTGILGGLAAPARSQAPAAVPGAVPASVSRTTKAVNYRRTGGAAKIDFQGTELLERSSGEAKEIGRASCRGRGEISVGAGSLKKKKN